MVTLTKAQRKAAAAAAKAAANAAPVTTTAPVVTSPPVVVAPATTNALLAQPYTVGKPYNVRPNTAADNAATWALIAATLQANGGAATRAQLQAAVLPRNHVSMVGYAIRRGWLVPATPSTTPAPVQATPAA